MNDLLNQKYNQGRNHSYHKLDLLKYLLKTSLILIEIPVFVVCIFIALTSISFSLFGCIIGIWAQNWERLSIIPTLFVTPLVFLGGSFYSISMLPEFWQKVTLFNPVLYIISAFRWSFFGNADVPIMISIFAILIFKFICITTIWWIFRNGYIIKQ